MPLAVNPKVGLIPFFIALFICAFIFIITLIYFGYCIGSGGWSYWNLLGFVPGIISGLVASGIIILLVFF